jgi:hypothetical protein
LNCDPATNNIFGWYKFDTNLVNVAADYNFVARAGYMPVRVDPDHRPIGDPRGWNWYTWWEPHGFNGGNPFFVNDLNFDFRLLKTSPLIGAALPLNDLFTADFVGKLRGDRWDIGARQGARILPPSNVRVISP